MPEHQGLLVRLGMKEENSLMPRTMTQGHLLPCFEQGLALLEQLQSYLREKKSVKSEKKIKKVPRLLPILEIIQEKMLNNWKKNDYKTIKNDTGFGFRDRN